MIVPTLGIRPCVSACDPFADNGQTTGADNGGTRATKVFLKNLLFLSIQTSQVVRFALIFAAQKEEAKRCVI